ncbi:hypothetical protein BpHYR1_033204 [Brachionus plicatilis]|uniref:Uncharacterized protein n=1 Tax=Brachionus plicatilis TaxID=10195 RepID=A0A3M7S7D2_BRAPC|nr:hypothetical protein BpHYR1_033204 [Brachionus plicatilis]
MNRWNKLVNLCDIKFFCNLSKKISRKKEQKKIIIRKEISCLIANLCRLVTKKSVTRIEFMIGDIYYTILYFEAVITIKVEKLYENPAKFN